MTKKTISKNIIKDIIIVALGVVVIWIGLQVAFGTQNPFYVVASGSMKPELQVYDVLVVQGHVDFEDVQIGDIIVFDRPSGQDRVIVHRVVSVTDEDPRTLRTKGDNNVASIPGTDFPITEKEYIGKVEYKIPQVGIVTQVLKPPVNYILIVIVIGFMIVKEIIKRKNTDELSMSDPLKSDESNKLDDISDLEKLEKDEAYSEHTEEKESTKTDSKSSDKQDNLESSDEKEGSEKKSQKEKD